MWFYRDVVERKAGGDEEWNDHCGCAIRTDMNAINIATICAGQRHREDDLCLLTNPLDLIMYLYTHLFDLLIRY
jgi:hypothetical protein